MAGTIEIDSGSGLRVIRLCRAHGNAINPELVDDLSAAIHEAECDDGVRGVLLAGSGKLFCPGLDLQELIDLDRPQMERFIERFNGCLLALYAFPKPLVSQLHGHAIAGGCVLALTTDWRVLREALVGLNEVRAGVPIPFGVATILRETVSGAHLAEVALAGRNFTGPQAVEVGLVHESHPAEGFEDHCRGRLEAFADKDPRAFAITKRYLRSTALERIRERDAGLVAEFIDAWFSPGTRDRLMEIAATLKSKQTDKQVGKKERS